MWNYLNIQFIWSGGCRSGFVILLATIMMMVSNVAFAQWGDAQLDEDLLRKLNTSEAFIEAYTEFQQLARVGNPKAVIAGEAVLEMAGEEFEEKNPVIGIIHMTMSTLKQGTQNFSFEDFEFHILEAVSHFNGPDGKLASASAIVLITLAESYLEQERFDEAENMLTLVHRDWQDLFDIYIGTPVLRVESQREFFEADSNDAFAMSEYRLALRSYAVWLRAQKDIERAEEYDLQAKSLSLSGDNLRSTSVNDNPYVLCLLPGEADPVHFSRQNCTRMGGSERRQ